MSGSVSAFLKTIVAINAVVMIAVSDGGRVHANSFLNDFCITDDIRCNELNLLKQKGQSDKERYKCDILLSHILYVKCTLLLYLRMRLYVVNLCMETKLYVQTKQLRDTSVHI